MGEEAKIKTVKMERDEPRYPGGPTEADCNVDAVKSWEAKGWRQAKKDGAKGQAKKDGESEE